MKNLSCALKRKKKKKITPSTAAALVALSKQPTRVGLCMTCGMFQACYSLPNRVSPEAEPMSAREESPPSTSQEPRVAERRLSRRGGRLHAPKSSWPAGEKEKGAGDPSIH